MHATHCLRAPAVRDAIALVAIVTIAAESRALQATASGLGTTAPVINQVVVSPSGEAIAFRRGDSLWIARARGRGEWTVTPIASQLTSQAPFATPFMAWAPDDRRLLYRAGTAGAGRAGVPLVLDTESGRARPLLPDSMLPQLLTTPNFLTAAPQWSPDGARVAFVGRYLRAGTRPTIFVIDLETGAVVTPVAAERSQYAAAWSPDGRWLAIGTGELRGGDGTVELMPAQPSDGTARVLVRDSARLFHRLLWSPDGTRLLAEDRRGGHVLLAVDSTGGATRLASPLPELRYSGWTSDGSALIASRPAGMNAHLVLVNTRSGVTRVLTSGDTLFRAPGVGHPAGVPGTTVLAYTTEDGVSPREIRAATLEASGVHRRYRVTDVARDFPQAQSARAQIHRWTSGEGDTLEAQLFVPADARSGTPLPLVVMPYGGYVNAFPSLDYFLDRGIFPLIARGYAVVRPNTRGISSDQRDRGQYGRPQLEDTERLLASLANGGVIDRDRVAVIGHSHGGAMAYYYLTHSRAFCAAVAVNGRADWILQARHQYDGLLPGILGATPDERPDVYAAFSPAANARQATAPLLAVVGEQDGQILPQNGPTMVDSMRVAGKRAELLVFPEDGHVLGDESSQRFWNRTFGFLAEHCAAG